MSFMSGDSLPIEQLAQLKEQITNGRLKYLKAFKALTLHSQFGFTRNFSKAYSLVNGLILPKFNNPNSDIFQNELGYKKTSFIAEAASNYDFHRWSFTAGLSYHIGLLELSNYQSLNNSYHFALVNRFVGTKYNFKPGHTISLVQSAGTLLPNSNQLMTGLYFINHNTLQTGSPIFVQTQNQISVLSYSFSNQIRNLTINTSLQYTSSKYPYITNSYLNRNLVVTTIQPSKGNTTAYQFRGVVDKFVYPLRTRINLNYNSTKNNGFFMTNNQLVSILQSSNFFRATFSSGLPTLVNMDASISRNRSLIQSNYKQTELITRMISNWSFATTIRFKIDEPSLHGNLKIDVNQLSINEQVNTIAFSDFSFTYNPKGKPWMIELIGRNSLSAKLFNYIYQSNNVFSQSQTNLVSPQLLLKLEYRLNQN